MRELDDVTFRFLVHDVIFLGIDRNRCDPNLSLLSTNAEEARPAFRQHLNVNFVTLQVQIVEAILCRLFDVLTCRLYLC